MMHLMKHVSRVVSLGSNGPWRASVGIFLYSGGRFGLTCICEASAGELSKGAPSALGS